MGALEKCGQVENDHCDGDSMNERSEISVGSRQVKEASSERVGKRRRTYPAKLVRSLSKRRGMVGLSVPYAS